MRTATRVLASLVSIAALVLVAVVAFDLRPPPPPPVSPAPVPTTTLDPGAGEPSAPGASAPAPTGTAPASVAPAPTADVAWQPRTAAPLALTEVAAAALGGRIWVVGGLDVGGRATDAVLVYDPVRDAWSTGPSLPEPVHHAALVTRDGALYLLGGYVNDALSVPTAAVRRLDPGAAGWTDDVPLPEARAAGAAVGEPGRLVYGGGVGPGGVSGGIWERRDGEWATLGAFAAPREHLGAAGDGLGGVWFLGGRAGGLGGNSTLVAEVAPDGSIADLERLPVAAGGSAGFWSPGTGPCLVGGEAPGGTIAAVQCLPPAGGSLRLPDLGVPRHGLGAVVVDGVAYVLLGGPEPGLFVSATVEALRLPGA
jgi:hypothetical protein